MSWTWGHILICDLRGSMVSFTFHHMKGTGIMTKARRIQYDGAYYHVLRGGNRGPRLWERKRGYAFNVTP